MPILVHHTGIQDDKLWQVLQLQPLIPWMKKKIGSEDIEPNVRFETRIEDKIDNFLCDVLSQEEVGVNEEAKKRQEFEAKIKEHCNNLLY